MSLLLPNALVLYRGAIRRERSANQPAFRPFTNLNHFYPVAGARQGGKPPPTKSRWTGLDAEQPEFVAHKWLHKNLHNKKQGVKIPLLKVLESLENFFQEVFKQGSGQRPEVFPPRGLPYCFSAFCLPITKCVTKKAATIKISEQTAKTC